MDSSIVPQNSLDELLAYLEAEDRIQRTDDGVDVFMTADEMASYFGVTRQAVSLHINNYKKQDPEGFKSRRKESLRKSSSAIREAILYNLDIIIYVGYRVNSTEEARLFREMIASMVRTQLAQRIADLQNQLNDARQVNRWLGGKQRAGYFLESTLPDSDRD